MNQWDEVANMRTVLLHLQFVCAGLEEKIDEQEEQLHRGRQDRILQLRDISQQNQHLQQSNFHHLLIVKIEELLGVYEEVDESIWQKLNSFLRYVKFVEEEMMRDVGKVYLGDRVMLDIEKCEQEFQAIQTKINSFLLSHAEPIQIWNQRMQQVNELQQIWQQYLNDLKLFLTDIKPQYERHLHGKLSSEQQRIDGRIQKLQKSILSIL